ncbi:MAG TPA: hypothetical protein VGI39_34340 [Polyangiaceae bacterium]|jgi:hypothetical protein
MKTTTRVSTTSELQNVSRTDVRGRTEVFGPLHPDLARELAARSVDLGYVVQRWNVSETNEA